MRRVPSFASSRATDALMLDFGRRSTRAAPLKLPCSITWQKMSRSSHSIVRFDGQCFQKSHLNMMRVLAYRRWTLSPFCPAWRVVTDARGESDVPEELLVHGRLG